MVVVGRGNSDLLGARVPHMWFAHMLTSAEMLFMVYTGVEAFSTQSQWYAPFLASASRPVMERQQLRNCACEVMNPEAWLVVLVLK